MHGIRTAPISNQVVSIADVEFVDVIANLAAQRVGARSPSQRVISSEAVDDVVPCEAVQHLV